MLLPRQKRIVELIYRSKDGLTTTELANALNISQRTVKSEIQKIKEELRFSGCEIHAKAGKGVWISYNDEGRRFLDNLMLNGESPCSFLPEVRKYYIALQLLDSDDFISMETISDSMYVSKGTVVNDINKLEEFFEKQGLSLERKVKYGVRILGREKQIRIAKANVIRSIVTSQGKAAALKLQPFFDDMDLDSLNEILQESEEKFSFVLTDASYFEMLIHLAIIVKRLLRGKSCSIEEEKLQDCLLYTSNSSAINEFLLCAGYNYIVAIDETADQKYKMVLKPRSVDTIVDSAKNRLSYGERNAFALVLFMFSALKENPDLVILDDPISSFDGNKKFAIINMLFLSKHSLKNRTVLLLTHEFNTVIDIIHTMPQNFNPNPCLLYTSRCV